MIDIQNTIQKFGYNPNYLSEKSDRKVCFECPSCERIYIKSKRRAKITLLCKECYLLAIKKSYYCLDCNKELKDHKSKRCIGCCQLKELNPIYKHGKTNNTKCIDCNIPLKNYISKRCINCYKIWAKIPQNNPRFGKCVPFFVTIYNNIPMRSTWEANFAKWCDLSGIKWLYESKTFDLGSTTYTPDFYLPEFDLWIEVKGWLTEKSKEKMSIFNKKENLLILKENNLKEMSIL